MSSSEQQRLEEAQLQEEIAELRIFPAPRVSGVAGVV